MKKKRKRNLMIILTILILPALIFKAYLTIGNINYEFEKAKLEADLSFPIKDKLEITKKTLKRNGYDIHYQVAGSRNKELIVFIHPAFSDHRAFLEQIEYFSKNYFVITVDLIGHGLSKANGSKDKIDISEQHILEIMKLE